MAVIVNELKSRKKGPRVLMRECESVNDRQAEKLQCQCPLQTFQTRFSSHTVCSVAPVTTPNTDGMKSWCELVNHCSKSELKLPISANL